MQVLADVGLLGLPNAGKSTLISAVSAAKPKIADYPFTTLYPNLGVVRLDVDESFVIADIPGLIEGAAEGHGLGIQFLKHLSRTSLLLHILDCSPLQMLGREQGMQQLQHDFEVISTELGRYSDDLLHKERWLVLNKLDLLGEDDQACLQQLPQKLGWDGKLFHISAVSGSGLKQLMGAIMTRIKQQKQDNLDAGERTGEEA